MAQITAEQRKKNNRLYIVQAAVEYHISLLMTGSFFAALTTGLGMSDALTGVLSSVISLGCVFQLLSLLLRPRRSRAFVTVLSVFNQLLFASLYAIPFLPDSDRLRIALFVCMTSNAGTNPPFLSGSICWETTVCSTVESWVLICACCVLGKASIMRSIALTAPLVCSVAISVCPVSAAVIAVLIVSASRISPRRITSGA